LTILKKTLSHMMHVHSSPQKKKMFGQNMILVMNYVLCMGF
jgi:hypothetical protein